MRIKALIHRRRVDNVERDSRGEGTENQLIWWTWVQNSDVGNNASCDLANPQSIVGLDVSTSILLEKAKLSSQILICFL
jgi:hypothetical protein